MIVVAALALLAWLYLVIGHGRFWQGGPVLGPAVPGKAPSVAIIVPARDEAGSIEAVLRSLLAQDYAGDFRVILVDDESTDATGQLARSIQDSRLSVLSGQQRPSGWSGKLWAVAQGIEAAGDADLILLTDADIVHDPRHLSALVAKSDRRDLVSEMVELSRASLAEAALVPAFVYFFQLLYPFVWVNDPLRATAAAAGGTILVRRRALERIGGIRAVRGALIDDVALAVAVKRGGPIWLGHSALARSIRPYPRVVDIWRMVARSAYVQLRYSPVRLVGCVVAMALVFVVPPLAAIDGRGAARAMGAAAWACMAWSYLPTLRRFRLWAVWAPFLPLVALFYTAATIGSAVNHWLGRGAVWKSRAYPGTA